jgi:hypothetical protein
MVSQSRDVVAGGAAPPASVLDGFTSGGHPDLIVRSDADYWSRS